MTPKPSCLRSVIARIVTALGVLLGTGCASSASLAREGNFPAACREARDETSDEHRVLRERLFATLSPRIAIELLEPTAASELEKLVARRFEKPRFARVTILLEKVPFEARLHLESIQDNNAFHRVGYVGEYLAADLVYTPPEGPIADLALVIGLGLKAGVNLTFISLCAMADEPPNCMGLWTESEREAMRRKLAAVDANPETRARKEQLLAAARAGAPLVVLLPNPSGRSETPGVRLELGLRTRFGSGSERCSYNQRVTIELPGNDLDTAVARHLAGRPRPIQSLRPALEYAPADD